MVGLPVRFDGHHSDPDRLSWAVVGLIRLNEGAEALGVQVQLRHVVENLSVVDVTFDHQDVRDSVAGLTPLDLRCTTLDFIKSAQTSGTSGC